MVRYIGGVARNLDISEVVNTFLPRGEGTLMEGNQAYIYGKGVGSGQGSMTFTTGSGYYILMCIITLHLFWTMLLAVLTVSVL